MRGRHPTVADETHPAAQYRDDQSMAFTDLPDEIVQVIGQKSSTPGLLSLGLVSRSMRQLLTDETKIRRARQTLLQCMLASKVAEIKKDEVEKARLDGEIAALLEQYPHLLPHQFLQYVVMDDQDKAEALLTQYPSLLYAKGTAMDFVGRLYEDCTAMQVAYATGNIAIYPEEGHVDMADMLKQHFIKSCGEAKAEEMIAAQIHEKFPAGTEPGKAYDFTPIFNAIINASAAEVQDALDLKENKASRLWQALEAFRKAFKELSLSELRYNPHHLLALFQLNDAQYDNFKNDNCRMLYARQVIGCVQRYQPVCGHKETAQGIYYLVEKKEARSRSFDFPLGGGNILSLVLDGSLGKNYWASGAVMWRAAGCRHVRLVRALLEKLYASKNSELGRLCARPTYTPSDANLSVRAVL